MQPTFTRRKWLLAVPVVTASLVGAAVLAVVASHRRPAHPGGAPGRLLPCPDRPNCVHSREGDVAPLAVDWEDLRRWIDGQANAHVVQEAEDYLWVEFTTRWLRFRDDVEFLRDGEVVQVRSESRVGHGDLGANARRVETIRAALAGRSVPP